MEDTAQIVASVFGQSSRLSFMNPAWTLISVMLTKKMSGTSQTNPSMPGNRARWTQGWTVPSALAGQHQALPCDQSSISPGVGTRLQARLAQPWLWTDVSIRELMRKHTTWTSVRKWLQIRKRGIQDRGASYATVIKATSSLPSFQNHTVEFSPYEIPYKLHATLNHCLSPWMYSQDSHTETDVTALLSCCEGKVSLRHGEKPIYDLSRTILKHLKDAFVL